MNIREQTELTELGTLCESACTSKNHGKRRVYEEKCTIRTDFQRDRDRILHSNAFLRLKQKTQVFLAPVGDHYRTRMTHSLEVAQVARTAARALRLNEDLTEAIALGHDLGHTPFGHCGEAALNEICPYGFKHYLQSVRVVDCIEKNGRGLNLTYEVKNGIACHTNKVAVTMEGYLVRLADKIAYLNHDIDDSIRAGVITEEQLPREAVDVLGHNKSSRITSMILSLVENGAENIGMSPEVTKAQDILYNYMYENVYNNPVAKSEEVKAKRLIEKLYTYYLRNIDEMPSEYKLNIEKVGKERAVCDYIAGMTDPYAINKYKELFIPQSWHI